MACKYHPSAVSAGRCAECGSEFCAECGVKFTTGTECLDCAARYAQKKISQSYIAIGLGAVAGLFLAISLAAEEGGLWILLTPILVILEAYGLFSLFWGWHYGGRVWPWLARLADKVKGDDWSFVVSLFFLIIRFMFSSIVGFFFSIPAFLWARNIVKQQKYFAMNPRYSAGTEVIRSNQLIQSDPTSPFRQLSASQRQSEQAHEFYLQGESALKATRRARSENERIQYYHHATRAYEEALELNPGFEYSRLYASLGHCCYEIARVTSLPQQKDWLFKAKIALNHALELNAAHHDLDENLRGQVRKYSQIVEAALGSRNRNQPF